MWGNGGWRCIEHTAPQRDWKTQISRMWEGEMEEVVRHYSCTLSVGSGYVLHQAGLERYLRARESPCSSFHRESACTSTAQTIITASAEGSAWLSQMSSRPQPGWENRAVKGEVEFKAKGDVNATAITPMFYETLIGQKDCTSCSHQKCWTHSSIYWLCGNLEPKKVMRLPEIPQQTPLSVRGCAMLVFKPEASVWPTMSCCSVGKWAKM